MLVVYIIISIISQIAVLQSMVKATKKSTYDGALTAFYQLLAGILILALIPFDNFSISSDWSIWLLFIVACIFYAINDFIITKLYSQISTSQITVLKQLSSVFIILIGLLIFKEPLTIKNLVGATIIIIGNVLILYNRQNTSEVKFKPIALGIIANLAMAIALSLDIDISSHYNLSIYVALSLIMPSFMIIISNKNVNYTSLKNEFISGDKKAIFIASLAQGIQVYSSLKAYQLGNILLVAPLLSLSVLFNALYELFVLKDTSRWKLKIFVSLMIFIAVLVMSM